MYKAPEVYANELLNTFNEDIEQTVSAVVELIRDKVIGPSYAQQLIMYVYKVSIRKRLGSLSY